MKYDFDINMSVTATIDTATVERMIRDIVEQQTGRKVSSLIMRVRNKTNGQVITAEFDGCSITFDGDKKIAKSTEGQWHPAPFKLDEYK